MHLSRSDGQPSHASIFGLGNPAHSGDPGKPLAALIEIDQPQQFSLDFAGGWGHDAVLAQGSYQPHFEKPIIATFVKTPGPIRDTTRFYINGQLAGPIEGQSVTGRDTVPDIQHRKDIGVFPGKALAWCGAFQGDIGEVLVYNTALSDTDRLLNSPHYGERWGRHWLDLVRYAESVAINTRRMIAAGYLMIGPKALAETDKEQSRLDIDPHQITGGRLELSRWIASPSNPLTARVLVNRVWQLHFGRGIVGTPDNFGTRGERPADPDPGDNGNLSDPPSSAVSGRTS